MGKILSVWEAKLTLNANNERTTIKTMATLFYTLLMDILCVLSYSVFAAIPKLQSFLGSDRRSWWQRWWRLWWSWFYFNPSQTYFPLRYLPQLDFFGAFTYAKCTCLHLCGSQWWAECLSAFGGQILNILALLMVFHNNNRTNPLS